MTLDIIHLYVLHYKTNARFGIWSLRQLFWYIALLSMTNRYGDIDGKLYSILTITITANKYNQCILFDATGIEMRSDCTC